MASNFNVMLHVNIWEELVRIREVLALDSYARQLAEINDKMRMEKYDHMPAGQVKERIERQMAVAEELDKVRTDMRKYCYPEEHL